MSTIRGTVVHEGSEKHHVCGPGWAWHEHVEGRVDGLGLPDAPSGYYWNPPHDVALGTVVECDCGKAWVCAWIEGYVTRTVVVSGSKVWRPEKRRERKRRQRRAARGEVTPDVE